MTSVRPNKHKEWLHGLSTCTHSRYKLGLFVLSTSTMPKPAFYIDAQTLLARLSNSPGNRKRHLAFKTQTTS